MTMRLVTDKHIFFNASSVKQQSTDRKHHRNSKSSIPCSSNFAAK